MARRANEGGCAGGGGRSGGLGRKLASGLRSRGSARSGTERVSRSCEWVPVSLVVPSARRLIQQCIEKPVSVPLYLCMQPSMLQKCSGATLQERHRLCRFVDDVNNVGGKAQAINAPLATLEVRHASLRCLDRRHCQGDLAADTAILAAILAPTADDAGVGTGLLQHDLHHVGVAELRRDALQHHDGRSQALPLGARPEPADLPHERRGESLLPTFTGTALGACYSKPPTVSAAEKETLPRVPTPAERECAILLSGVGARFAR
mmetsp:Transcript_109190/g.315487  ORF Transcript_109190/g.315487 Transcript_109190/m.315487 type:complete len:263 (-) Transcript_109190:78-866(-)